MPAEPGPAERARLAAEALAQARQDARARGEAAAGRGGRRGQAPGPSRARGRPGDGAGEAGQAGSGQDPAAGPAAEPGVSGPSGATGPSSTTAAPAGTPGTGGTPAAPGRAGAARAGAARPGRRRRGRRDDPEPLRAAIGGLLDARGWRDDLAVGGLFGRWGQIVGAELAAHTRPDSFTEGELLVTADSTAWATQVRLLAGTLVARVNAELGGAVVRRVRVRGPAPPPPSGPWRVRGGRGPRGDYG